MRILFLSSWFPVPSNNGSRLRIRLLLRGLAQHHDVTLIALDDQPRSSVPADLRRTCSAVKIIRRRPYNPRSLRALQGFLSPTPRVIVDTYAADMESAIRSQTRGAGYDLVIASQWDTVAYWPAFEWLPAIFEEAELGVFVAKADEAGSGLMKLRHSLTLLKLVRYFRGLLRHFGACTVVSDIEAGHVRRFAPDYSEVCVIPNFVDVAEYGGFQEARQANSMIFTGSFRYFANHDAMVWFLKEVYWRIRSQVPNACLTITGDHAGMPLPPSEEVTLSGLVDDVRPLVASATVSLAPIRIGGGTRLKILEAMALNTPVVATSKGVEGLDVRDGVHLLIADAPPDFANAVVRLLREPRTRRQLTENAHELLRQKYDQTVVMPRLLKVAEKVAAR